MKLWIVASLLMMGTSMSAQVNKSKIVRRVVPNEYVAIVKNAKANKLQRFFNNNSLLKSNQSLKNLKSNQKFSVVRFKASPGDIDILKNDKLVEVVGPNYVYLGDAREQTGFSKSGGKDGPSKGKLPNDPMIEAQQYHTIINSAFAWKRGVKGKSNIVVAITDDGVDIAHPDLASAIWINKKEIPGNNIDDDGNGYIDDVKGWDFTDVDNNPQGGSHGTHVAGIVGATINNEIGVAGTAAGVSLMALRWYGGKKRWTTELIVESYTYAMNNGAHIINTSYNIDWLANDEVYREMVKILKKNNVLLFNSAGNGNAKNPRRQAIEEVTLVASTYGKLTPESKLDKRSRFSNYGTGIDIAAPGEEILATCLGSKYCEKSGTSMAAPNAAAVAAMIWSVYPKLTGEQVLHKLFTSTDNIDEANKDYKGYLGAGRINVAKAISPNFKSTKLRASAYNKKNGEFIYQVKGRLHQKSVPKFAEILINGTPVVAEFKYSKNNLRVRVASRLPSGKYKVAINPAIFADVFGRPVDLETKMTQVFKLK